jgi:hypothetical protein
MNRALALRPDLSTGLEDLVGLAGLPSQRRSASQLSADAQEIIKGISSFVDGLLLRSVAAQNQHEFAAIRNRVFGDYAKSVTCLANLVRMVVPDPVIERVLAESFCELESDFREHGLAHFGPAARDQAMFTVWTLRRTSGLISKIAASGPAPSSFKHEDQKTAEEFSFHTAWAQFHMDCMLISMRRDQSIKLEVLPEIIDGLRAAVDAYGYARHGLNLRSAQQEPLITPSEWDEEDEDLLECSMQEMQLEALDD